MLQRTINAIARRIGYEIVKRGESPPDFEKRHLDIVHRVTPFTLTGPERIYTLIESVRYLIKNDVPGAFVECGVYKGGSMMTVALTLQGEGVNDRDLYLFDTFEGMPKPTDKDIDIHGVPAIKIFSKKKLSEVSSEWANASLESVKNAMASTGYPAERIHYVKGLVENTIPAQAPASIALLRLDTDWYQSTKHEMDHLYQRVSRNGVTIVDDYGHFRGAKEAVDEYFSKHQLTPFMHRIDYTGRLIVNDTPLNH
ncbi:MAG TPA: TylF/MycF/NovP-related O-methyltransferase [Oligoflexus sp.]|uniref:TylF/MycF/NovP-related O-methyltransferase n=1 Tax=Oligoflexus sp. TaxID=1971216 RepID=UPI002D247535|nr:TylF/MycF/NovP-related O-methyltransferase [Oligoflexus sp.]HYX32279.1 TylF/MycF/NovP-related O-methyltransferase [Oligoflexus sp.]